MYFDFDIWAMLLKELFSSVECVRRSRMRRCDWIAVVEPNNKKSVHHNVTNQSQLAAPSLPTMRMWPLDRYLKPYNFFVAPASRKNPKCLRSIGNP